MEIIYEQGRENLAKVYVARLRNSNDYNIEFVESLQPPLPLEKKWVIIVSTSFGCPVHCLMCDASLEYKGRLTTEEILKQIDYLVSRRFPTRKVPVEKFKIQFARMGEPAFNPNVLDALEKLSNLYDAPGLLACISTLAPQGRENFFFRLLELKDSYYSEGKFQLQFSVHTTEEELRDKLMPIRKWTLEQISQYGEKFFKPGDRKITLNFAVIKGYPVVPKTLRKYFNPEKFVIKLTPLNPTRKVRERNLNSFIDPYKPENSSELIKSLQKEGFEVILSIGEIEENEIGSNCGYFLNLAKC
jgi:23S rRNA (adenine2503-C2)-methyltransferase